MIFNQNARHAHFRRPLQPGARAHGAGTALPAARGAHADDPRMDRAVRRSHPQTLSVVHESGAASAAPSSWQVAASGGLFQPLDAAAGGDRAARERAVVARRGAGGGAGGRCRSGKPAGCGRCRRRLAPGDNARRAVVPGVRSLPSAATLGAHLVRAHRVPRHRAGTWRSAAPWRLQRLRQPHGDRAPAAARRTLSPLRRAAAPRGHG